MCPKVCCWCLHTLSLTLSTASQSLLHTQSTLESQALPSAPTSGPDITHKGQLHFHILEFGTGKA